MAPERGSERALPDPLQVVRADGPWSHRDVAANGSRFHVAELGEGPLVVLLHGFAMFWWTWRRQLGALAGAGYRAVAMDLRGYGGSDHPPHGYDPFTLASDVAGVIRSLGESSAVVVGHGVGGLVAWTLGTRHADVTTGVVAVGSSHPVAMRHAVRADPAQRRALRYVTGYQRPFWPEHQLTARDGAMVARLLRERSATADWPSGPECDVYRAAMLVPATAHCAVEFHRWAVRSIPRRDGRGYAAAMREPVAVPVLQVHGTRDPHVLPASLAGTEDLVDAPYEQLWLDCGHVPHEETPAEFSAGLLGWLDQFSTP